MPQIHDPLKSLIGARTRRGRIKVPVKNKTKGGGGVSTKNSPTTGAIGEDLLDFLESDKKTSKDKHNDVARKKKKHSTGGASRSNAANGKSNNKNTTAKTAAGPISVSKKKSGSRETVFDTTTSSKHTPAAKSPPKTLVNQQQRQQQHHHHHPHLAVAIDNRCINTAQGVRESDLFLYECRNFLQALDRRGLTPSTVSSCTELYHHPPASKKKTARPPKNQSASIRVRTESIVSGARSGSVPIVPMPTNTNLGVSSSTSTTITIGETDEGTKQNPVGISQHFTGYASWKLFCDFVDSIVPKGGSEDCSNQQEGASDITIITNDICFLADTSQASHKRGMDMFWERVKPHFVSSAVRRVQIVLYMTNAVVVDEARNKEEEESESNSVQQGNNNTPHTRDKDGSEPSLETLVRHREIAVADCLSCIQKHFAEKADDDFKANRSYIQFAAKVIPSVNITISAIESTCLGFMSILREWSREFLSASHRVTFALPETLDFDECPVRLDAMYKTLPFSLDSTFARAAMEDLARLSDARMEVVKLVPIASIDASLLYGIPIEVRPALERDLAQHNHMRLLVGSLFKQMSLKDCALLLNIRRKSTGGSMANRDALFHSNDQAFLLMVEEVPATLRGGGNTPSSGIMYRIAVADQLISDTTSDNILDRPEEDCIEAASHLSEYVDACMDCLETSPLNPLYMEANGIRRLVATLKKYEHVESQNCGESSNCFEKSEPISFAAMRKNGTNVWTDDSGVGSLDCRQDNGPSCGRNDSPKLTWNNTAWTDTSGVGSRNRSGLSQDSDALDDLPFPRSTMPLKKKKQMRMVASSDDSVESVNEAESSNIASRRVSINNKTRQRMASKIASTKTHINDESGEEEFSDDLGDYISSDTDSAAMSI